MFAMTLPFGENVLLKSVGRLALGRSGSFSISARPNRAATRERSGTEEGSPGRRRSFPGCARRTEAARESRERRARMPSVAQGRALRGRFGPAVASGSFARPREAFQRAPKSVSIGLERRVLVRIGGEPRENAEIDP